MQQILLFNVINYARIAKTDKLIFVPIMLQSYSTSIRIFNVATLHCRQQRFVEFNGALSITVKKKNSWIFNPYLSYLDITNIQFIYT